MEDSTVDSKPVIGSSGDEPNVAIDVSKAAEVAEESAELPIEQKTESEVSPAVATSGDKEAEPLDEKMDIESSGVETAATEELKTAESEAIEEPSVDDTKGVDPSVEAVPEVAVKSPSEVSSINMVSSPAPAVQSSTPPRSQNAKKPKVDLTTVPVRQYLDTTVVPILLQALSSLARERPAKPIAYLANFLNEKASEYDE